jgi:hypothetical protein
MKTVHRILFSTHLVMLIQLSGMGSPVRGQEAGGILINEFLASNSASLLDPDFSQYADWIELYNPTAGSVHLSHLYLTDDLLHPQKWQIPEGITIQANQYFIFWADGEDNGIHTNFKLDKGGEAIGLFDQNGSLIDSLTYGNQITDISYGRDSTNPSNWLYYAQPTPGAANTTVGLEKKTQSDPPVFSLASGFYTDGVTVSLFSHAGGTIRYTTDGSVPTSQSVEYQSSISFTSNTILKARVYQPDRLPSQVLTRSYFINEQTTLPILSLSADPENLWSEENGIYNDHNIASRRDWERPAHIEFFESMNQFGFELDADIRLFGRSALYIPEKSLSIFLSNPIDYPLFGSNGEQKYYSFVLRSSSDDWHRTLFRDAFIQMMASRNMTMDIQNYRPAILFINGEYWGIHNIREKYNEDYLTVHHGADPDNIDLLFLDVRPQGGVEVLAGDREKYDALLNFIQYNDLASQANYNVVAGMMDIDNFMDYTIVETFTGNTSWAHNIRMWRPRTADGKWQWLMFDMDRGFRTQGFNAFEDMRQLQPIFASLVQNQDFRDRFLLRFSEYLNDGFRTDRIIPLLDSLQAGIAEEIPRHSERWRGICGNNVCGIESFSNWQGYVESMRSIAQNRPDIVRQQLIQFFDLTGMEQLFIQITPSGFGQVQLGGKTTINQDYTGTFFQNASVDLIAQAENGYRFVEWQGNTSGNTVILGAGSVWKYFDEGVLPDAAWNSKDFNDDTWQSGPAKLGYGDNDEATQVSYGPDSNDKYITTYFRTSFQIEDISNIQNLVIRLLRDDGAIIYLNGQEILRSNMPEGPVNTNTWASANVGGDDENNFFEFFVSPDALVQGNNSIAVELHQDDNVSSDIGFDLELDAQYSNSNSGDTISTDSRLSVLIDQTHSFTAVFSARDENRLPSEITQNTVLTAAHSPYIALTDVTIHSHVSLTLEAGVEVQLAQGASIYINGNLSADGHEDAPIIFRGIGAHNRWGALCFENTTDTSALSHVIINGATTGADAAHFKASVSAYSSDLTLNSVRMENVGQPFYAHGGTILLDNSTLDGTGAGDDIVNIQSASARVENCHLFGNGELDFDSVNDGIIRNNRIDIISDNSNRDGIDIGASENVLIANNKIFDCPDKGISVGEKSTVVIRKNLVVNTGMAIAVKDGSTAYIDRNTFHNDSLGVACYEKVAGQGGGFAEVINTVFSDSHTAEFSVDAKSTIQINYSLSNQRILAGVGNIMGDPRFLDVNDNDFYLQADSPCIDAGDPSTYKDPDSSRADIGAFFYNSALTDFSHITINEFMASNTQTLADNANEYDDWIEIYNSGDFPVNLGSLYMTDDLSAPTLWQISSEYPDSTTVQPRHFLILWADSDTNQGVLHTGFQLNASGEQIALIHSDPSGTVIIDSLTFGRQTEDVSYGRLSDGGASWKPFSIPTPGYANTLITDSPDDEPLIPTTFAVYQNYPNPFNPETTIAFDLPCPEKVTIDIFNSLGQRVTRLIQEQMQAGRHRILWPGTDASGNTVSSGLYFYKVSAGESSFIRKMVFLQ